MLEEAAARSLGGPGLGPALLEAVADRMECESSRFMAANIMARFCLPWPKLCSRG